MKHLLLALALVAAVNQPAPVFSMRGTSTWG